MSQAPQYREYYIPKVASNPGPKRRWLNLKDSIRQTSQADEVCAHDLLEKPGGFLEDVLFLNDNVVQRSWFKDIEHPMLRR